MDAFGSGAPGAAPRTRRRGRCLNAARRGSRRRRSRSASRSRRRPWRSYVAGPLMSLIDAGFVGRRSSFELAALGPAGTISDSMTTLFVFLVRGYDGSSRESEVWRRRRRVRPRRGVAGRDDRVIVGRPRWCHRGRFPRPRSHAGLSLLLEERRPGEGGGAVRRRPRARAAPAALIASVAQAACLGLRDATTPGLSVAIAAVLNFMGDFLLVPRQGLLGAAVATAASQYAAAYF